MDSQICTTYARQNYTSYILLKTIVICFFSNQVRTYGSEQVVNLMKKKIKPGIRTTNINDVAWITTFTLSVTPKGLAR